MNANELIKNWKAEEEIAHIHGWDFSHIDGRYTEQDDLPWDYRAVIEDYLTPDMKIMDIDTGGGEFLLSLNHPHKNTAAMENYLPNVELCKEVLLPLGVDFRSGDGKGKLPFDDGSFDMVINRHGDFNAEEIYRNHVSQHCQLFICTSGAEDITVCTPGGIYKYPVAPIHDVVSTVGAGDSMVAAMAFSQARNLSREETIRLAIAMGAASVMQSGSQPPEAELVWELAKQVRLEKL